MKKEDVLAKSFENAYLTADCDTSQDVKNLAEAYSVYTEAKSRVFGIAKADILKALAPLGCIVLIGVGEKIFGILFEKGLLNFVKK